MAAGFGIAGDNGGGRRLRRVAAMAVDGGGGVSGEGWRRRGADAAFHGIGGLKQGARVCPLPPAFRQRNKTDQIRSGWEEGKSISVFGFVAGGKYRRLEHSQKQKTIKLLGPKITRSD